MLPGGGGAGAEARPRRADPFLRSLRRGLGAVIQSGGLPDLATRGPLEVRLEHVMDEGKPARLSLLLQVLPLRAVPDDPRAARLSLHSWPIRYALGLSSGSRSRNRVYDHPAPASPSIPAPSGLP